METLLGILAAFGTAAAKSVTDISTKAAAAGMGARALVAVTWCTAAAMLVLVLVARYPVLIVQPKMVFAAFLKPGFWWILALDGTLNAVAAYFYVRALTLSDASLVAPLMLLTPIFMLATSPLMLGESVPPMGVAGIGFAVAGAWLLGRHGSTDVKSFSLIAPFRVLVGDRGVRSMLITVTIWSITSNLDKMGVLASTPLVWSASISSVVAVYSLVLWLGMRRRSLGAEEARLSWQAGVAGGSVAVQSVLQNLALTLLLAPYVIAIKRTSAILTVLASGTLLREATDNRLAGAAIMLLGTVLMVFASYG